MRILYISGPAFFDLDLSFVKSLGSKVECFFVLDLYPKLHRGTAVNVRTPMPTCGILPVTAFRDFDIYRAYLDPQRTFVINRIANHPLAPSNLWLQWKAAAFVRRVAPDVVHFNNYIYFNHFYLFLCRGRRMISIHDPVPHSGDEQYFSSISARATRLINNKLVRNHLLFNRAMAPEYRETSALHKTNIVSSGLSVYEYLTQFSQEYADSGSDILFFGRISRYKGLKVLLAAFLEILGEIPDARLIIAGAGDFEFDINSYRLPVDNLKIINRFVESDELACLIRRTKVVVCPYTDATQSGVVMTAYALCKPVVATKVGALDEMVEDGVTGRLVPPNDARSLAQAIIALLKDKDKRLEMAKKIRSAYFEGEKSWDRITDELLVNYKSLR